MLTITSLSFVAPAICLDYSPRSLLTAVALLLCRPAMCLDLPPGSLLTIALLAFCHPAVCLDHSPGSSLTIALLLCHPANMYFVCLLRLHTLVVGGVAFLVACTPAFFCLQVLVEEGCKVEAVNDDGVCAVDIFRRE